MKYSFKKQIRSFGYAWKGIRQCVGKEQNLSFHLITTAVVIAAGFFFGITRTEWIVIILCIGVVIAAELFNTAIEKLVDLVSPGGNYRNYYFSPVFKLRERGKELI